MVHLGRVGFVALLFLAACGNDDDGDDPPGADAAPRFAECPAAVAECGFADDGWNVWCDSSQIWVADLTEKLYCDAASTIVCEIRTRPDPVAGATCALGCATTEVRFFGDLGAYQAFDPQSLCSR